MVLCNSDERRDRASFGRMEIILVVAFDSSGFALGADKTVIISSNWCIDR